MQQVSLHQQKGGQEGEVRSGISGNTLKMIAVITMLIDHIGAGIVEPFILNHYGTELIHMTVQPQRLRDLLLLDSVLRTVGRIAFPIFCFLLVEGFLHTKNIKKYAGRLFLFGLISEIPFDLTFFGTWFQAEHQNVYITLFIGLSVLIGYRRCESDGVKKVLVVLAGCAAAFFLKCDYDAVGVMMIVVFYEFRWNKKYLILTGGIIAAIESIGNFSAAILALIPIHMYNGTRGRMNLKYFFYWFYPAHIMVIYLVRTLFLY